MTRLICVAGAESTGKSWLAGRLAAHYQAPLVTEYARRYCAQHGNHLGMDQLVHIGQTQDAMIREAMEKADAEATPLVIADTDAIVTSVWARMGHGTADAWFRGPLARPDLVLVMANDLPWEDDGVRIQSQQAARDAFRAALIDELRARGLAWAPVSGAGDARFAAGLAAIDALHRER